MNKIKRNWTAIIFSILALVFILVPVGVVMELYFYLFLTFLLSALSSKPLLLIGIIVVSVLFLIMILVIKNSRKGYKRIIYGAMFFSIFLPISTSYFDIKMPLTIEEFVFCLMGILLFEFLIIIALFGKIKGNVLKKLESRLKSDTLFIIFRSILYIVILIIFTQKPFEVTTKEVYEIIGFKESVYINNISIILGFFAFMYAENLFEYLNKFESIFKKIMKY